MESKSVVVIDPDPKWTRELGKALSGHSQFAVLPPAHAGSAALLCIQRNRPDIIILELLLGDYDGLYLLNHIRERMDGDRPLVYILSAMPLRHPALPHQAIAGLWNRIYIAAKPQRPQCVIENLFCLLQTMPDPAIPAVPDMNATIDAFLFKLDHRFHLKRYTAAKAALGILLREGKQIKSMNALYEKTVEITGGTKYSIERNLRSYRDGVKEADTDFYRANLARYNTNNSDFYWNALRLLGQEIR